jgi:DNA repair photolyase
MNPTSPETMSGKPVLWAPARSVINFKSHFGPKLLCDGLTFSTGLACVYGCAFCYVPSVYRKLLHTQLEQAGARHDEVVIRRERALEVLRSQLSNRDGSPKFADPNDRRVIYSSPAVDVAANMTLVKETVEACKIILSLTNWDIRLLSKSNLLPKVAEALTLWEYKRDQGDFAPIDIKNRMIFGVSTGTLDDGLAAAFEKGTAKVSKRLASLHWLQDHGFRTYGMICPSLPQEDYTEFARSMADAIRADRCEHVWAEPLNVRGESMTRTCKALVDADYVQESIDLLAVSTDQARWEDYARATFLAHSALYEPGKLRFLQYVKTPANRAWWEPQVPHGAVLL